MKNLHQLHDALLEAKKFVQVNPRTWSAVFLTGQFNGVYDYGAGIVEVSIHLQYNDYEGVVSISTVDDGMWQAFSQAPIDEELAKKIIEVFNQYTALPTEEELNNALAPLGLYGMCTG